MLIRKTIMGQEITLETGDYYFSPKGIDKGTLFMLSKVQLTKEDKVLDLGCGYGVVGIAVAKEIFQSALSCGLFRGKGLY